MLLTFLADQITGQQLAGYCALLILFALVGSQFAHALRRDTEQRHQTTRTVCWQHPNEIIVNEHGQSVLAQWSRPNGDRIVGICTCWRYNRIVFYENLDGPVHPDWAAPLNFYADGPSPRSTPINEPK